MLQRGDRGLPLNRLHKFESAAKRLANAFQQNDDRIPLNCKHLSREQLNRNQLRVNYPPDQSDLPDEIPNEFPNHIDPDLQVPV